MKKIIIALLLLIYAAFGLAQKNVSEIKPLFNENGMAFIQVLNGKTVV